MTSLLHMNVVETWFVAVWGLCWCNFFFLNQCKTIARGFLALIIVAWPFRQKQVSEADAKLLLHEHSLPLPQDRTVSPTWADIFINWTTS